MGKEIFQDPELEIIRIDATIITTASDGNEDIDVDIDD